MAGSTRVTTVGKVCILLGALVLIGAAYLLFAPFSLPTNSDAWECGSAVNRASGQILRAACRSERETRLARGYGAAAVALVLMVGGPLLFRRKPIISAASA